MRRSVFKESPLIRGYRELLGVTSSSTEEDIKKAYRKVARLYHPDVNKDENAAAQFQKVKKAFDVLSSKDLIERENARFVKKNLYTKQIGKLKIHFGSFFGLREFEVDPSLIPNERRIGAAKDGESDQLVRKRVAGSVEKSVSITDSAACDAFELIYAGKMKKEDVRHLRKSMKGSHLGALPWVVLNNKGIFYFLEEQYSEALKAYEELNKRVPNNIIFLYRLGLCYVVLAFQRMQRTLLGRHIPNRRLLKRGVSYLRKAILVGESREVGKQDCLLVRKVLADVLEASGRTRESHSEWQKIYEIKPKSREAEFHLAKLESKTLSLMGEFLFSKEDND